jgi:glycosyltransferase involved in cell wall biosynthesis
VGGSAGLMRKPLVSIVTAAYKTRPDHLSAAIQSALCQTWREVEITVSDDSPDQSLGELVRGFGDRRIRYRHNEPPLGVARNHWACFQEAQGEYIAILNHDDWFAPTFLERLTGPLQENPGCALAFCDHWVVDAEGRTLNEETEKVSAYWQRSGLAEGVHRPFFHLLASQTIPLAMGTVFRRQLLPPVLPDDAGPAYDLWLTYLLCRESLGAYYVRERLSSWRSHAGNLTSQGGADWSYGTAQCWRTILHDPRLASIRPVARRKAALAFRACAVSSWLASRRAHCFSYGWQSLWSMPTWKGMVACVLPLIPTRVARCAMGKSGFRATK